MPDPGTNTVRRRAFTVDVPGGRLHGAEAGDGRPLLVLHGGPGLNDYSDTFAPELEGWHAITYHQRGPAPSLAPGPYTVAAHVADAQAVLDRHELDRVVVLGHSWGAFLACCLAAVDPHRVAGLVLVDGLGMVGDGGLAEFAARRAQRCAPGVLAQVAALDARVAAGDGGNEEALDAFALMWPTYFANPDAAPGVPATLRIDVRCSNEAMESVTDELDRGETAAALTAYTAPVDIIYGDASPMPAAASLDTAALFPNASCTAVAGGGHLPWVERPGCVAEALGRLAAIRLGG